MSNIINLDFFRNKKKKNIISEDVFSNLLVNNLKIAIAFMIDESFKAIEILQYIHDKESNQFSDDFILAKIKLIEFSEIFKNAN